MLAARGGTLVLGGGFGGAHVARLLGDATLVSPESSMLFTPLLPEVAAGALEPRHAYVPLRMMCPDAEQLRGRVTALDQAARTVSVETELGRGRGVLPASRDRPGLRRADAAHPGPGRARDDVQGPRRRRAPAQPRAPPARPGRGRPAPREPPPRLRLRRCRLRGRRGAGRAAAARRGRRPPLPGAPGRAPAMGPGRRRSRHPGRGAPPARGPHDRAAAPAWCRDPDVVDGRVGRRAGRDPGRRQADRHRDPRVDRRRRRQPGRQQPGSAARPERPDRRRLVAAGRAGARTSGPWATAPPCPTPPRPTGSIRRPASTPYARPRPSSPRSAVRTSPYAYRSIGEGATLGRGHGVARVFRLHVHGRLGSLVTRAYHLSAVPVRSRRLRILADGLLSTMFRRDIAELGSIEPERADRELARV